MELFHADLLTKDIFRKRFALRHLGRSISGPWWTDFSDEATDVFQERLGHYWVQNGHRETWWALFTPEIAEWNSKLLQVSEIVKRSETKAAAERARRKFEERWCALEELKLRLRADKQLASD